MSDIKHAQALFNIAQRDFKAAKAMLNTDDFDDPVFGFQIQQSVEKLLKAWLSLKGVAYTKTHDLESLAELLLESGVCLPEEIQDALPDITMYAVIMRYLDTPYLDEPIDRSGKIQLVNNLIRLFEQALRDESIRETEI